MEREAAIEIFRRAYDLHWQEALNNPPDGPALLSYEMQLNDNNRNWIWKRFESDFTRALTNDINRLAVCIHKLFLWNQVFEKFPSEHHFALEYEFSDAEFRYALNLPSILKDKFVFTITHLSHQANRTSVDWKDDLKLDHQIDEKEMKRVANRWPSFQPFYDSLQTLAPEHFKSMYRNREHHQIPPNLGWGHSQTVFRIKQDAHRFEKQDDGAFQEVFDQGKVIGYVFGALNPLTIQHTLPLLRSQHDLSVIVFDKYWNLVLEQARFKQA
jgi:hypothetical protein